MSKIREAREAATRLYSHEYGANEIKYDDLIIVTNLINALERMQGVCMIDLIRALSKSAQSRTTYENYDIVNAAQTLVDMKKEVENVL